MRSSMWSTIPTPWRQPISAARSSSSTRLEALAVERDREPGLEPDLDRLRLVGRLLGAGDQLEDVVLGRVAEILDPATLRGTAPEVVVDRVGSASVPPLTGIPCSRA